MNWSKSFLQGSTLNRHRKIKHGFFTRNPRLSDSERLMAQRNRNSRQCFQREFIKDRSNYIEIAMREIISNRLTDLLFCRKLCVCEILKKNSTQNSIENQINVNQRIIESHYKAIIKRLIRRYLLEGCKNKLIHSEKLLKLSLTLIREFFKLTLIFYEDLLAYPQFCISRNRCPDSF